MVAGSKKFLLIALFTLLLVALVNVAWWIYYEQTEEMLEAQLSTRLTGDAALAATLITDRQIDGMYAKEFRDYLTVKDLLTSIANSDSLAEVFVLDFAYEYLASSHPQPDSVYLMRPINQPYIDSILYGGVDRTILGATYQSGDIRLKTAFAPLKDSEGNIAGVVGAEARVDYFDVLNDLEANLIYSTVVSLAGGLVLGLIFLGFQRRINRAEQHAFLNQTHAYLGRMVAVVTHELKNPLMIIRGSAERLRKKTQAPEAEFVLEEVDRLNEIVSGYLDFARAGGKLLQSDRAQEFDLTELATTVRRHFTDRFREQNVEWLGEMPVEPIRMTGYPRSLRQVLLNLLINAAEACLDAKLPIKAGLSIDTTAKRVEIQVKDAGPGIPPNEARRLFEPFHTTKTHGSGLGLYLSRQLVEEMDGTIKIDTAAGRGTTVTIALPREKD